jgi:hypothetical protein
MEQDTEVGRVNIKLPMPLRRTLRARAVMRGQTLGQYIQRAIENQFRIEDGTAVVPEAEVSVSSKR